MREVVLGRVETFETAKLVPLLVVAAGMTRLHRDVEAPVTSRRGSRRAERPFATVGHAGRHARLIPIVFGDRRRKAELGQERFGVASVYAIEPMHDAREWITMDQAGQDAIRAWFY